MPFSINRLINEQVCVQSPPSALNMTLHAFAADNRRDKRIAGRKDARPLHRPCSAFSAGSANKAMVHCRRRPRRPATLSRHSLGARRRLGHDATNTTQQGRQPAHDDAMTSLAATISIDVPRIVHVKL